MTCPRSDRGVSLGMADKHPGPSPKKTARATSQCRSSMTLTAERASSGQTTFAGPGPTPPEGVGADGDGAAGAGVACVGRTDVPAGSRTLWQPATARKPTMSTDHALLRDAVRWSGRRILRPNPHLRAVVSLVPNIDISCPEPVLAGGVIRDPRAPGSDRVRAAQTSDTLPRTHHKP